MSRSFGANSTDAITANLTASSANQKSIFFWTYYAGAGGGGFGRIFTKQATSTNTNFSELINDGNGDGQLYYYRANSSGTITAQHGTTASVATNAWTAVGLTHDQTSGSLTAPVIYYNGASQSLIAGASSPTTADNTHPYLLGNAPNASRNWNGMIAWFTVWSGILLSAADMAALAAGMCPALIRPEYLQCCLPLDGVNNPEPDLVNGVSSSITGTRLGTSEPPVRSDPRTPVLLDMTINNLIVSWRRPGLTYRRITA